MERRKVPNIRIQANIHPYTGSLSSLTLEHFGIWLAPCQAFGTPSQTHTLPHAQSPASLLTPQPTPKSNPFLLLHLPLPSFPLFPALAQGSASCCSTSRSPEGFSTSPLFFALSNTPLTSQAVSQHVTLACLLTSRCKRYSHPSRSTPTRKAVRTALPHFGSHRPPVQLQISLCQGKKRGETATRRRGWERRAAASLRQQHPSVLPENTQLNPF